MAVARQHIFMHLAGHPLPYGIDIRFHCGRGALEDFVLVGRGEEFSDVFRHLRGHVGWYFYILISVRQCAKDIANWAFWGRVGHDLHWRWRRGCAAIALARIASSSVLILL